MQVQGVHHVAIICSDYKKSKQFYTETLSFTLIQETYRAARNSYKLDLQAGNCQIELFSFPDPPQRVNNPEACGLRHLAFRVDNLHAAIAHLRSWGVSVEEVRLDELTGQRFTFFRDPDDLPLELYENS
jgi:glyoxylase I family protein